MKPNRFPLMGVGMWDEAYVNHKSSPMMAEVTMIPMGNKCKCRIKGKILCIESNNHINNSFMTTPDYMRWFGTTSEIKSFFSKGRIIKKVIDLRKVFAPWHIHPCDRIV